MLTSTALVYLMTPGLGFFYGGMVDTKNVINTLYMSFITMAIVTVQWVLFGYSFAFGRGASNGFFGDFSYAGLTFGSGQVTDTNMGMNADYSPTYPQYIHVIYQCAFAVITPALISGGLIGRLKFSSYCIFVFLWSTICYDALAHWLWSAIGWARVLGSIDFAGGNVVHIASGVSALVAAKVLGPRTVDASNEDQKASPPFIMLGTALLWVGWMGFNAGSANGANTLSGVAMITTNVAAASAALTWAMLDHIHTKNHGMVPACVGAVVGLVVITPGAGFVSPGWALLMGILGAIVCFYACRLKRFTGVDDSLDVFFCHGVGGIVGGMLTGFFAEKSYNGSIDGAAFQRGIQLWYQLVAILATIGWSTVCTVAILMGLKYTIGLRVSEEHEAAGMDLSTHGELWMPSLTKAGKAGNGETTSTLGSRTGSTGNLKAAGKESTNYEAVSMVGLTTATLTSPLNLTALIGTSSASGLPQSDRDRDQVHLHLPVRDEVYNTV